MSPFVTRASLRDSKGWYRAAASETTLGSGLVVERAGAEARRVHLQIAQPRPRRRARAGRPEGPAPTSRRRRARGARPPRSRPRPPARRTPRVPACTCGTPAAPVDHTSEDGDLVDVGEQRAAKGRRARAGPLIRVPPMAAGCLGGRRHAGRYLKFHAPVVEFAAPARDPRRARVHVRPCAAARGGIRAPSAVRIGVEPVVTVRDGVRRALLADVDEIAVVEVRPRRRGRRGARALRHSAGLLRPGRRAHGLGRRAQPARRPRDVGADPAGRPALALRRGQARYLEVHAPGFGGGVARPRARSSRAVLRSPLRGTTPSDPEGRRA